MKEDSKMYVVVIQDSDLNEKACEVVADSLRSAVYEAEDWCRECEGVYGNAWEINHMYAEGEEDDAIEQVRERIGKDSLEWGDTRYA